MTLHSPDALRLDRRTVFGAVLIALAVLAVYGGTAGFAFVYDDHLQIERNPWLRSPDGLWNLFTQPFWGFYPDRGTGPSNYYRPLYGAAYVLTARLFGLQPVAFHMVSILLHLTVSLLVAAVARRLVSGPGRDRAALAAGLLFAVHPAHAEAVAWVGGQADVLAGLFALVGVWAYLETASPQRRVRSYGHGVSNLLGPLAYLLACLSKETGAALFLVLATVEVCTWRAYGSVGSALRRIFARLAPYALAFAAYLALRIHALGGFAPRHYGVTSSLASSISFAGDLFARYLGFLVVPFPPRVLATVPTPPILSPLPLAGLGLACVVSAGMGLAVWNGRAKREIVLPLAFLLAFLLPALATNSIGGSNFAERYLYVPSIGLAWLVGLAWSRIASGKAIIAFAVLGIAATGAAAWHRSRIFETDFALFQEAVRTNPKNEIARNNLGMALYSQGRLDEAEHEYRESLRLRPGSLAPLTNLALLRERRGDLGGAQAAFEKVLRLSPAHAISAVHLARIHLREGDPSAAAQVLDAYFAAGGEGYDALVDRAALWMREGKPERAIPLLEKAVETFPEKARGREMLARAQGKS